MQIWCRVAALAALLGGVAGCGGGSNNSTAGGGSAGGSGSASQTITVKGSDTMVNLGAAWAEAYMKKTPGAQVSVTGGGSGTGIAALINHTTDIAMSSRDIKDTEKAQIEKGGGSLKEFAVAQDALTVGVHPSNSVKKLTIDQLSDIFTGKSTDWGQVGGAPGKIAVLSRERSSGTHVFFLEHILRKGDSKGTAEFAPGVLMMPASQAIVAELARNPRAIGYYGLGYHDPAKVQAVSVPPAAGGEGVEPSEETVLSGKYPISRPLYLYTAKEPDGAMKDFIEFCQGPEGQQLVSQQEFVPVKK